MLNVEGAKVYIKELVEKTGDSGWIEGWICGYTDPDHKYENIDKAHNELFEYLQELRASNKKRINIEEELLQLDYQDLLDLEDVLIKELKRRDEEDSE